MGYIANSFDQKHFEQMLDGIAVPIFSVNSRGVVIFANASFVDMYINIDNNVYEFSHLFPADKLSEIIQAMKVDNRLSSYHLKSIKSQIDHFNINKSSFSNEDTYIFSGIVDKEKAEEEREYLKNYLRRIISLGDTSADFDNSLISNSLSNLSILIKENQNVTTLLRDIAKKICILLDGKGCLIWMRSIDKLIVCGQYGLTENYIQSGKLNLSKGQGITGKYFETEEIAIIPDLIDNPNLFYTNFPVEEDVNCMLIVPMRLGDKNIGLINIFHAKCRKLSPTEKVILNSYGTFSATVLRNIMLIEELKKLKDRYQKLIEDSLNSPEKSFFKPLGATINHEIKNMLNNFKYQFEDILLDSATMSKLSAKRRQSFKDIEKSLDNSIKMTKKLSEFFSFKSGDYLTDINVKSVIQNAALFLSPKINSASIELNVDRVNENILLRGNYMEILLIIFNLLTNAIKSILNTKRDTIPKGHINITAYKYGNDDIMIEVDDDGVGIKNEIIDRIWDAGFTTDSDEANKSSGIGLFGCRMIIEGYNGSISVDSSVGKGSTFKIQLPIK